MLDTHTPSRSAWPLRVTTRQGHSAGPFRAGWLGRYMLQAGGVVVYAFLLQLIYIRDIQPLFSYMGPEYLPRPLGQRLLLSLMAVLPLAWLPRRNERPSSAVLWLLYLLVVVPTAAMPAIATRLSFVQLFELELAVVVSFWTMGWFRALPQLYLPSLQTSPRAYWTMVSLLGAVLLVFIVRAYGLSFNLVALDQVYDVRSEFELRSEGAGAIAIYGISWLGNVICTLYITESLLRKNLLFLFGGLILQLLVYSITGQKSLIMLPLLTLFLYSLFARPGRDMGSWMIFSIVVFVVAAWGLDLVLGDSVITSLFTRRMMMIPGILTGYYVQFFSEHPFVFLSHSIFSPFSSYPYPKPFAQLIGDTYFTTGQVVANANIWADAYANFGYFGMFIFAQMLGGLLWMFDSLTRRRNVILVALMVGSQSINLSNSALLTTMLTHGFILAFILVYLYPALSEPAPTHQRSATQGSREVHR